MRVVTPPEIDRLFEMQLPYAFYDETKEEWRLHDDAPIEVKEARARYLAWMEAQREV